MWYLAAAAVIIIAGGWAGFSKGRHWSPPKEAGVMGNILNSADLGPLTVEQVNYLLSRLETQEPPEPVFGAMCYEAMAAPEVAEYICPVCGEKTIYSNYDTVFIEWELQGARRLADTIQSNTQFDVALDETLFCDFCSGGSDEDPRLMLRVVLDDGEEIVNAVSLTELRKLDSFLRGRLYWVTSNDGQEPLQEDTDLIRRLLGITE